jgi:hypothetical protein
MAARYFFAAALCVVAALPIAACTGEAYNDGCIGGAPCSLGPGGGGGGECPSAEEARCCPDGGQNCASELLACRPKAQCKTPTLCASDDQCPGPPDPRCGVPRCEEGKCGLEVWPTKAIPNQFPGDCKVNMCSWTGDVEVVTDPSDLPDDGNPCTLDTCEGDAPSNTNMPDKALCPGESAGICDGGKCKECSDAIGATHCPKGYFCDWDQCIGINTSCATNEDGQETGTNCGGPDCHPCGNTNFCKIATDCISGVCEGGKCQWPTPTDGVKNGDESGVDCGYPGGPPNTCKDGDTCGASIDCMSGVCYLGLCQAPTCTDTIKNGTETGNDCGGECSPCLN